MKRIVLTYCIHFLFKVSFHLNFNVFLFYAAIFILFYWFAFHQLCVDTAFILKLKIHIKNNYFDSF